MAVWLCCKFEQTAAAKKTIKFILVYASSTIHVFIHIIHTNVYSLNRYSFCAILNATWQVRQLDIRLKYVFIQAYIRMVHGIKDKLFLAAGLCFIVITIEPFKHKCTDYG